MFEGMRYIYEVYKVKSFSKAAQNLYISQPSLSATIKKIEGKLGVPLFDRSTSPIQLTEFGKEYIKTIEKIIDLENNFSNYLSDLNELTTGTLNVGGSNFFASFILPPFVSEFKEKYPQVLLRLLEDNTASLEKNLFEGNLDLVIDNFDFNPQIYERKIFCEEHLLLAVPKRFSTNDRVKEFQLTARHIIQNRHLKSNTPFVSLNNFSQDPFVLMRMGNDTRIRSMKICQNHGITPNIALKLDQQITAYHITCYGMGISFVSDRLIQKVRPDPNVIYYRLADDEATRNVYFYHKKNKYVTRSMEEFLRIAKSLA